jgi:hypothetical protein
MPLQVTPAPGGGTSVGQALGGALDEAAKDKLAIEALNMPGIRESMGTDVADFISKGSGAHKRLGAYMAQADRLSGGKVSKMNRIVQSVAQQLQGRQNVRPEEVLQLGLAAADADNRANPQSPPVTTEDVNNLYKQLYQGPGRTRATAKPAAEKPVPHTFSTFGALTKEADKQYRSQLVDLAKKKDDAARKATITFIENDPILNKAVKRDTKGTTIDIDNKLLKVLWRDKLLAAESTSPSKTGTTTAGTVAAPEGSIRVRVTVGPNKGRTASVPEADFDPKTMERLNG